ncbi:phosphomannomutase CpsG [Vibrio coralliilyticus]|uniref:phosphomannomutase CpsG n=1 Tax=Vibrio coralliilyticus TaxID=190893 RepID=UPI000BAAAF7A|nr:phosphomannomutase CpsG [Vibrio coralliilyticus]PAU37286.1 phosphomannomutase CpsG [Vibrio coralliilyticus]
MEKLTCFKAYDIRGKLGDELNEDIAYRIGRAFGQYIKPKNVVLGGDVRESSESLKQATANGLMDAGVDVIDIGMTGTEEVYFATKALTTGGGIEVTASHNPINYNGMKLVREESKPISGDTGLKEIQEIAQSKKFDEIKKRGTIKKVNHLKSYVDHILTYINTNNITPIKLVVNAGNGSAGHVIDAIENEFSARSVPIEFIKINHEPDPSFPNGIPNPLLQENRKDTSDAVIEYGADMGIAWDGDFDRCFLFDEKGNFIEGYYIVGLLAEAFLQKQPNSKIIHDPRLTWNTIDIVNSNKGIPVMSKTGHAFIKERMRKEDAVYGGEMSAHHYFKGFGYCDSGMIPWLLVSELLCLKQKPLSSLVEQRIGAYPSSGEINSVLDNPEQSIQRILENYSDSALEIDHTDGISLEFTHWRFNLRTSNTEPVVRLNVESKGDFELMEAKTKEVLNILRHS